MTLSRSNLLAAALVVVSLAGAARAQEATPPPAGPPPPAPSADEIKKVTNYFLKGKDGGPILMDFQLCTDVAKNEEGKNTCAAELPASAKKGDAVTAFVRFFAPKGGKYEDLKIKFLLDGEVRTTSDFTVTDSWTGYTNYKKTTLSKAGNWEVQVLRGETVLQSKKVTVQ